MKLYNCTNTPRGFRLGLERIIIEPRGCFEVPDGKETEMKAYLKTPIMQAFLEGNIFKLEEQSREATVVKGPEPPEELKSKKGKKREVSVEVSETQEKMSI